MVSGLTEHYFLCYIRSTRWEGFLFIDLLSSVCTLWEVLSIHIKLILNVMTFVTSNTTSLLKLIR